MQGEAVLRVLGEAGAGVIAEDLGTVPDFVRATLARMDIPGFKVLRWERRWKDAGTPFCDPRDTRRYPLLRPEPTIPTRSPDGGAR